MINNILSPEFPGKPDLSGAKMVSKLGTTVSVFGEGAEALADVQMGRDPVNAASEFGIEGGLAVGVPAAICAVAEPCGAFAATGAVVSSFIGVKVEEVPNPACKEDGVECH